MQSHRSNAQIASVGQDPERTCPTVVLGMILVMRLMWFQRSSNDEHSIDDSADAPCVECGFRMVLFGIS